MKLPLQIIIFFLVAQLLGMYTGWILHLDVLVNPYVQSFVITENTDAPENAFYFFLYILFGAIMLVILMKYFFRWAWLFKLLEFFLIATASSLVFYSFGRLAFGYVESMALGIVVGLLFSAAKWFQQSLKNAAAIIATAGVGAIFGISLGIFPVMLFLVLLAVYDYVAVFISKHMVKMADFLIKRNLAFTVTAREKLPGKKEKRIDLGTGDLIAPIMFEVAAMPLGLMASLFVLVGAVVSLSIFLFLVWKRRLVLPAIPPIVAGCLVFFFLGQLLGFY